VFRIYYSLQTVLVYCNVHDILLPADGAGVLCSGYTAACRQCWCITMFRIYCCVQTVLVYCNVQDILLPADSAGVLECSGYTAACRRCW